MVNIQVNEAFYRDEFGGDTIPSLVFEKFINEAEMLVLNKIKNNIEDVEENETDTIQRIKLCQCELADFNYKYGAYGTKAKEIEGADSTTKGEVKSESVGTVSVTYTNTAETFKSSIENKINNPKFYVDEIIKKYLATTGLLYGGIQ